MKPADRTICTFSAFSGQLLSLVWFCFNKPVKELVVHFVQCLCSANMLTECEIVLSLCLSFCLSVCLSVSLSLSLSLSPLSLFLSVCLPDSLCLSLSLSVCLSLSLLVYSDIIKIFHCATCESESHQHECLCFHSFGRHWRLGLLSSVEKWTWGVHCAHKAKRQALTSQQCKCWLRTPGTAPHLASTSSLSLTGATGLQSCNC